MNEYLRAFQDITQSAEQLLTDEHNSLEIQQSATRLGKSVQPCIEELKQSATKLKGLVHGCFNDLYHAEDVWHSKPRIAQAAKDEIWQQLGEISGRLFRIRSLANQLKRDSVGQAIQSWDYQITSLKSRWFIDSKGQLKKGIGWGEKEGFIKQISPIFNYHYVGSRIVNKGNLSSINAEINSIKIERIQYYISFLDNRDKAQYTNHFASIINKIEEKLSNPEALTAKYFQELKPAVNLDLTALINNGWGDIYWEDVVKFRDKISYKIEKFITAIFDDRVELVTEALEPAIAFYNDFLERQERYQQETPEQREAEKAWIDQQRQQLEQVQRGIEAILNDS
ncbi:MAG TPA: hypothetical protein V6C85_01675 [Allocoleopsis sp.]